MKLEHGMEEMNCVGKHMGTEHKMADGMLGTETM
jgi:hypothetical protein